MNIENPLSPLFMGLLVALPGLWWTARALSFRVCSDYRTAQLLTPGFTVILWLLAVHLGGLVTHHFSTGLLIGTLVPAAYGYVSARRLIKKDTPPLTPQNFPWQLILAAEIGTMVILPAVIFWDFHDKDWHFALTAQIVNDIYPPRDSIFANLQLSYHYGIDTLFAMVMALTRLRVDLTIDLVTVLAWWYTLVLFGLLGERLFGERAGLIGILLGGFAGGFPWWLETTSYVNALQNYYVVGNQILNPTFTSYFFQHPWTLGTPLLVVILLLWDEFYQREHRRVEIIYALSSSFIVLGFSNMTLFLTLSASTLVISVLTYLKANSTGQRNHSMLLPTVAITAAIAITPVLGGMSSFLLGQNGHAGIVFTDQGIAGNWLANLQWHLANFGFLLPLGIIGLLLLKSPFRGLLALLVVGSILTLNIFKYERTWDIVKFATVVQIILAIASVGVIVRLLKSTVSSFKFLAWLLSGTIIATGLTFHLPFWLSLPINATWLEPALWRNPPALIAGEEQAISWLRHRISVGEIVLCPKTLFSDCKIFGGFPFLYDPTLPWQFGFPPEWIVQRQNLFLINHLPVDIKPYLREGVKWAIIPSGVKPWEPILQAWSENKSAELVATFDSVKVFHLLETP